MKPFSLTIAIASGMTASTLWRMPPEPGAGVLGAAPGDEGPGLTPGEEPDLARKPGGDPDLPRMPGAEPDLPAPTCGVAVGGGGVRRTTLMRRPSACS